MKLLLDFRTCERVPPARFTQKNLGASGAEVCRTAILAGLAHIRAKICRELRAPHRSAPASPPLPAPRHTSCRGNPGLISRGSSSRTSVPEAGAFSDAGRSLLLPRAEAVVCAAVEAPGAREERSASQSAHGPQADCLLRVLRALDVRHCCTRRGPLSRFCCSPARQSNRGSRPEAREGARPPLGTSAEMKTGVLRPAFFSGINPGRRPLVAITWETASTGQRRVLNMARPKSGARPAWHCFSLVPQAASAVDPAASVAGFCWTQARLGDDRPSGSVRVGRDRQGKGSSGGQGRTRTADAGLFRAALYHLSYLAARFQTQFNKSPATPHLRGFPPHTLPGRRPRRKKGGADGESRTPMGCPAGS